MKSSTDNRLAIRSAKENIIYPNVYNHPDPPYNSNNDEGGAKIMDFQKYLDHIDQDRRDMERRLTEERRLSEERHEKRIAALDEKLEFRFSSIDQRFTSIDQRFDRMEQKIDELSGAVHRESKDTKRWVFGIFMAVTAMVVASIVGVVAIVISLMNVL